MKKRILSILIALVMVITMMPSMVFAIGASEWSELADAISGLNFGQELVEFHHDDGKVSMDDQSEPIFQIKDDTQTRIREIILLDNITADVGDGALIVTSGVEIILDLNGYTLDRGLGEKDSADDGNVIINYGTLTIKDSSEDKTGSITGGNSFFGGGVDVLPGGKFYMNGGNIIGNIATSFLSEGDGGGVHVRSTGVFTMTGGTITCNTATNGGGVYVVEDGTFTMTGGEISGNTATNGGGVYIDERTFTMTGGTISGNTATNGGGVYNTGNTLSDGTTANNLYLPEGKTITLGTSTNGSDGNKVLKPADGIKVGVTMQTPGVFVNSDVTADIAKHFFSDDTNYYVTASEGKLKLAETALEDKYNVWIGGTQITAHNKDDVLHDDKVSFILADTTAGTPATLTLNGVTIKTPCEITSANPADHGNYYAAINSNIDLKLVIEGKNILGERTDGGGLDGSGYSITHGVYADGCDLTFAGTGSLTVIDYTAGIKAKNITFGEGFGKLVVEDCGKEIAAELPPACAINASGNVKFLGGSFDLTSYNGNGINANGGVKLSNCSAVDIDAGNYGIYSCFGDVIIDNCNKVDINAVKDGINQDYVYVGPAVSYSCSVIIKDCGNVNIVSTKGNCIYAGGFWNDNGSPDTANDDTYISGGDVTISGCEKVTLNNANSDYDAIYLNGGVTLTNCDLDIDAGWNGIYAQYGDIEIDKCRLDILAMVNGIVSSYCNTAITDSEVKSVCDADAYESIWEYRLIWWTNWVSGIVADRKLTINNSTVEAIGANIGCDFWYTDGDINNPPDVYDPSFYSGYNGYYWAKNNIRTCSYGLYAEDMIIADSKVTAKGGTADYANGIDVGSVKVTGNSILDIYGGSCEGSAYDYPESYAIYAWRDAVLDGKNVIVNLHGGTNNLAPDHDYYGKVAYDGGWWYDEDNKLITPSLTVKNGANLIADSSVWVSGGMTIDGGNVQISTPIGSALSVGGYVNEGKNEDDYFGKLTMQNNSSLIATTNDASGEYSAVYSYKGIDVKNSEFFASATSGDAIGCTFGSINFNGKTLYGSTNPVAYENRNTVNKETTIGYNSTIQEYTASIGDDAALTVYINDLEKYVDTGSESSYSITSETAKNGSFTVDKKSASAGSTVTITVKPDKGFTLETLTVLDKNGKEIEVKNLGNNKYSFKMPSGKVTISATFMEDNSMLNFCVDVKADNYYYDAVLWAYENGICAGTDAVHFSPDGTTTRGQMITFLWRLAGSPVFEDDDIQFADIKKSDYFYDAVVWGWNMGIVSGKSETRFTPNDKVTRGEAVTFIYRYAKVAGGDLPNPFNDVKQGAFYYYPVLWAANNGITFGVNATTFNPGGDCTRGQIVTFLYRYNNEFGVEE